MYSSASDTAASAISPGGRREGLGSPSGRADSATACATEGSPVRLRASFRDPKGFVFEQGGRLYRHIAPSYGEDLKLLKSSGLLEELWDAGLLVRHEELPPSLSPERGAICVLSPERIPFISYPSEWCFSQLRDAALLTLDIALRAENRGMTLRDASAFNVQFLRGKPIFIDTLSFERAEPGAPWAAYRQFCQHFLAPLALMAKCDVRYSGLYRQFIDGIPLDLASRALPIRSYLSLGLLMHVHLHARSQRRYESDVAVARSAGATKVSKTGLLGILDSLRSTVLSLQWRPGGTEWGDYYEHTNYSPSAMSAKEQLVQRFVSQRAPKVVWDLGGNAGRFSRVAAATGAYVVSADIDPTAVEKNYRAVRRGAETLLLPLLLDLTNPTPSFGWHHAERSALLERGPADLVMALALIHHLAISNNVPLTIIAEFFRAAGRDLVIEFVPKSDSQVKRLLASRPDIFPDYTREGFEEAFRQYFSIVAVEPVEGSERLLYLMTALPQDGALS